jgi:hypothetical protein
VAAARTPSPKGATLSTVGDRVAAERVDRDRHGWPDALRELRLWG